MSICIAALCEDRKSIVLAADRMVSNYLAAVETGVSKIVKIHDRWWAMLAGGEPGQIATMLDALESELKFDDCPTLESLETSLVDLYRARRDKKAEASYVLQLGMTLQEFLVSRQYLGDATFERILANIQAVRLDGWITLCGFDAHGVGHVFSIETPGYVTRHDFPGWCAIGSGATNAIVSLYWRGQDLTASLPRTTYNAYEAKSFASMAPGVGAIGTQMIVLTCQEASVDSRSLTKEEISSLETVWKEQTSLPDDLDQRVSAILAVG